MPLVYVALLGEATPVWRPVQAHHVQGAVYELLDTVPSDEEWQFQSGELVECEPQVFSDGSSGLVALRPSLPNNSFKPTLLRGSASFRRQAPDRA